MNKYDHITDNLLKGNYRTAYDPIAKRYVNIRGVKKNDLGIITVFASRITTPEIHSYNTFELCGYS